MNNASSAMECMFNALYMLRRCLRTVRGLIDRSLAICLLVLPAVTASDICCWRGLSRYQLVLSLGVLQHFSERDSPHRPQALLHRVIQV